MLMHTGLMSNGLDMTWLRRDYRQMTFDGEFIFPDESIYVLPGHSSPKYKNPTFWNAYVKILDLVSKNGEMSLRECCSKLFGGSNFDTFKTLVVYGFLECLDASKRSKLFKVSGRGMKLLDEAKATKPVYDLLEFIETSKSSSYDEFNLNCTLYGEIRFLDDTFKSKVLDVLQNNKSMKSKVCKVSWLIRDYLAK